MLMVCLFATLTFAQNTTGKIVGSVSAPDGVIPGATIVVTDNQTKRERTITANADGTFEVSTLEFGTYTVVISAAGFKTLTTNDVKIDVGREFSLNARLEVGGLAEVVTVTASGGEQINSSNGELSTTVSKEQIRELPLNGRNPLSLLNLQAGVNATTSSINGQRSSSTTTTRDGLNVQDNFIRTNAFVSDQPTVDDTGEFTVTTQNAGAEQGGGSSLIQLVTPRGGSEFHGALYAFNRNSIFAANSFSNNLSGLPRAFLNRNQYGGSISGPTPFFNFGEGGPVFDKKKAFFFFNYESFRLAQQTAINGLTTLLPQARNGDFTFVDSSGASRTVNVLRGTGFTSPITAAQGGILSVDPIIQSRLLDRLPTSGNGITTGINYTQRVNLLRADPRTRSSYTSRFDYDVNDRNSFNFVYRRTRDADARTDLAAGFSDTAFVDTLAPTDLYVAAYRTTVGSSFTNEVRGGVQDAGVIFNESQIPSDFLITGLPFTNPEGSSRTQGRNTIYRNIQDNAVYSIGNHSIRFGAQAEWQEVTQLSLAGITPSFEIATTTNPNTPALTATQICGTTTCVNTTDLARINNLRFTLGGVVGRGTQTANLISAAEGFGFGPQTLNLNYEIYSGYISDQWRVKPNLSLNLGLRYEYYTPLNNPEIVYLEPVIPDINNLSSVARTGNVLNFVGTNAGKPGDFTRPDRNNFGPNISFAYSPNFEKGFFSGLLGGGTVLRGAFRVGYINDEYLRGPDAFNVSNSGLGAITSSARGSDNTINLRSTFSPTANVAYEALPGFATPGFNRPPRTFLTNNQLAGNGGGVFGVDPNYQSPRIYEYSFGIQREIGFKNILEVRYVGSMGNDQIRSIDYNQFDLTSNGFLADFQRAASNLAITDAERGRRNAACTAAGGGAAAIAACMAAVNTALPRTLAFNGLPGSQLLPVLTQLNLTGSGSLANATNIAFVEQGRVGSLAQNYVILGQQGGVRFQPTSDAFSIELLTNGGKYRYNSLQTEIRRRFSQGFSYQVNYTFQKVLGDIPDDSQLRQSPFQDNNNPGLQYGRTDYDRTHTLNANMIYELPFGKGKRFLDQGGFVNALFGGFQFSSIINLSSGAPLGVIDPRSTAAITGRSTRQSAISSLTTNEIKDLTGIFNTPNGIYFVNPSILNAQARNAATGVTQRVDLTQALPAGFTLISVRAASPVGTAPFEGQVFFFNQAGQTGNLPRNFINGTPFFNWDASLSKNFRFTESMRLQLRFEAFNVLNRANQSFSADLDINSTDFGRILNTNLAPRTIQFGARFDF
jgi:hypothetical protein